MFSCLCDSATSGRAELNLFASIETNTTPPKPPHLPGKWWISFSQSGKSEGRKTTNSGKSSSLRFVPFFFHFYSRDEDRRKCGITRVFCAEVLFALKIRRKRLLGLAYAHTQTHTHTQIVFIYVCLACPLQSIVFHVEPWHFYSFPVFCLSCRCS